MVRALIDRWTALRVHPRGRYLAVALEVLWIVGLVLGIHATWGLPQSWFGYLAI